MEQQPSPQQSKSYHLAARSSKTPPQASPPSKGSVWDPYTPSRCDDDSELSAGGSTGVDLHHEIALAVRQAISTHNASWQAALERTEQQAASAREDALARATAIFEERLDAARRQWEADKGAESSQSSSVLRAAQAETMRARQDLVLSQSTVQTLQKSLDTLRAESVPLATHRTELLGKDLQLHAREITHKDALRTQKLTCETAVSKAQSQLRLSEERASVLLAVRETELAEEALRSIMAVKEMHAREVEEAAVAADARVKVVEEALAAEKAAHEGTLASLSAIKSRAARAMGRAGGGATPDPAGQGGASGGAASAGGESTPAGAPTPARSAWTSAIRLLKQQSAAKVLEAESTAAEAEQPGAVPRGDAQGGGDSFSRPVDAVSVPETDLMRLAATDERGLLGEEGGMGLSGSVELEPDVETSQPPPPEGAPPLGSPQVESTVRPSISLASVLETVTEEEEDAVPPHVEEKVEDDEMDLLHAELVRLQEQLAEQQLTNEGLHRELDTVRNELQYVSAVRPMFEACKEDLENMAQKNDHLLAMMVEVQGVADGLRSDLLAREAELAEATRSVRELTPVAATAQANKATVAQLRECLAHALSSFAVLGSSPTPDFITPTIGWLGDALSTCVGRARPVIERVRTRAEAVVVEGAGRAVPTGSTPATDKVRRRAQWLAAAVSKSAEGPDSSTPVVLSGASPPVSASSSGGVDDDAAMAPATPVKAQEEPDAGRADAVARDSTAEPCALPPLVAPPPTSAELSARYAVLRDLSLLAVRAAVEEMYPLVEPPREGGVPAAASTSVEADVTVPPLVRSSRAHDLVASALHFTIELSAQAEAALSRAGAAAEVVVAASPSALELALRKLAESAAESGAAQEGGGEAGAGVREDTPTFDVITKGLAQRYAGLLALLSSTASDDGGERSSAGSAVLAARCGLDFLSGLAKHFPGAKASLDLLQAALDAHVLRGVEEETRITRKAAALQDLLANAASSAPAPNPVEERNFGGPGSPGGTQPPPGLSSPSSPPSSSKMQAVTPAVLSHISSDVVGELISTVDTLREAVVAVEHRHASALATAALHRESAAAAVSAALTAVSHRDEALVRVQAAALFELQRLEAALEVGEVAARGVLAAEEHVRALSKAVAEDRGSFLEERAAWAASVTLLTETLGALEAQLAALQRFEEARAPYLARSSTLASALPAAAVQGGGVAADTSDTAAPAPPTPPPRSALFSTGASGRVFSAASSAAGRAKATLAARKAEAEEAERLATEEAKKVRAAAEAAAAAAAAAAAVPASVEALVRASRAGMASSAALATSAGEDDAAVIRRAMEVASGSPSLPRSALPVGYRSLSSSYAASSYLQATAMPGSPSSRYGPTTSTTLLRPATMAAALPAGRSLGSPVAGAMSSPRLAAPPRAPPAAPSM